MTNSAIADQFALLAKLYDIHGENSFKSKSYSIAAYTIDHLGSEVSGMSDATLFSQKGIGQSTGEKILELIRTGTMDALQKILAKTPAGILEMLSIKGLGPKKIHAVWKELGIENVGELEYACTENRLVALKGFGAKTQQSILDGITFFRANQGLHLLAHISEDAAQLVGSLRSSFPGFRFEICGDLRRQMEILDGIEMVTDTPLNQLMITYHENANAVIDASVPGVLGIQIEGLPHLRFYSAQADDFYKELFIRTGSQEFTNAFKTSYSIPEVIDSEEDIFTQNKLTFIPPFLREAPEILITAAKEPMPAIIQVEDIKGIIHSHSTWSDGAANLEEMATAAIASRFEYLVISDHSQAAQYADGLKPDQIFAQRAEIETLNRKFSPFKIFQSIEVDILNDGTLDYTPEVLGSLDLVITSVHSNLNMTQEKAMDRIMKAIENPYTTILGHMTGRLLLSRKGYPVDHKAIIDACARNQVVIELNANPRRLDMDWRWIEYALEKGVLISINPDAHSVKGFRDIRYGVLAAQKAGLKPVNNLSSYNLDEMEAFLNQYRLKTAAMAQMKA